MLAVKGLFMEKWMCFGSMGVAGVLLLLFLLDVIPGVNIPFGGINPVVDVLGILACGIVLYLAFDAPHVPLQAPAKYLDRVRGIAAISAPIREPGGIVTASLTIAGPAERCTHDKLRSWVPDLTKATQEISELLGRSRRPVGSTDSHM